MTSVSESDHLDCADALDPQFGAIYEEHFAYVWVNLRRLGVHAADLDDAVQETFLVVFRRWRAFDPRSPWRAWLFGIARRIAWRYRRGTSRRLRLREAVRPSVNESIDAEDQINRRHAAASIEAFLDRLEWRKREVFILAEIEGFTIPEIGRLLGVGPNTVGSRLRAARATFDRFAETLRARERGLNDRAALLRRCRRERPPAHAQQRVRQVLGARVMMPLGGTPWWAAMKPVAIATGIGLLGLGSVGVVTGVRETSGSVAVGASTALTPSREVARPRDAALDIDVDVDEASPEPLAIEASRPATSVPAPARHRRAASRSTPIGSTTPEPEPTGSRSFAAETALVGRIRTAMKRDDPEAALRLAKAHALEFADGVFERERRALAIAALCRLGRTAEAAAEAMAHARAHPEAPLPPEVRAGCSSDEKPTARTHAGEQ
jgi:RNA polymerase sigma factor (sigma-70 family)